jgi:nitrogen-specific signal transduction histidine kinase/CheY-like chemotaxis protein
VTNDRLAVAAQAQRLEALGRLAGGVAHDFNNLLAVIGNYTAFVAEEVAAAAVEDPDRWGPVGADVEQIRRATGRAADLTHQLLSFARREVIQPQVLDLNTCVAELVALLRRTLGDDIELVTDLTGGLDPILADPGRIQQMLMNLAINARDAMPDGGTLRVDTCNVAVDAESVAGGSPAAPGRYVRLRVSDTGTGMPADVVDQVFEPFFTTKVDGRGTGLGLATVYGVVTGADGIITVTSHPGVGTTFTVLLPVTDDADGWALHEPASYTRTPKGETVLVVDDEPALREVTARILTRAGYRVLTASGGAEAVRVAEAHDGPIHLLLTDVVMPTMLGKEVAERIRAVRPTIEVLFMSGYAQPVLASQGRLAPGVALVDKPFSEAALLAKVAQVLNGHFKGFKTRRGR